MSFCLKLIVFISTLTLPQFIPTLTFGQVCTDTFYHKRYVTTIYQDDYAMVAGPSNEVYTAGYARLPPPLQLCGTVSKINEDGSLAWSKIYYTGLEGFGSWTHCRRIIYSTDNSLIIAGVMATSASTRVTYISKINLSGTPIWTKSLPDGYFNIDIAQLQDGSIVYIANSHFDISTRDLIGKLDLNGNQLWCKAMNTPRTYANSQIYFPPTLLVNGNDIYLSASNPETSIKEAAYFFRINAVDGSIVWQRRIAGDDFSIHVSSLAALNGIVYFQFEWRQHPSTAERRWGRLGFDATGNLVNATYIYATAAEPNLQVTFSRHDPLIASLFYVSVDGKIGLVYTDTAGTIKWKREYNLNYELPHVQDIVKSQNGGWFVNTTIGVNNYQYFGIVLSKVSADGMYPSCQNDDANVNAAQMIFPVFTPVFTFSDNVIALTNRTLIMGSKSYPAVDDCKEPTICTSIAVNGPHAVCSYTDTVRYTVQRNPGCIIPLRWQYDNAFVSYSQITDSSASFVFRKNGQFQLIADLNTGCGVADTIQINVGRSAADLSLGDNKQICPGNTLLLNARNGFASYLWQDGSADSTFLVTGAGTYYVRVYDYCNNFYSDTIVVTESLSVPIDIGPDLSKCNHDTIILSAPAGLLNYSWGPAYNISDATAPVVFVFPATDTTYTVKAEVTSGCYGYDTVRIKVNISPPAYLGPDAMVCYGDSLTLDPGPGFDSFTWSNGAITREIIVDGEGLFYVTATDTNQCSSYDTILVMLSKPEAHLDKTPAFCSGHTLSLLNSNNFSSYLWSSGDIGPAITIYQPGTYWVRVTDANDCPASDTTQIAIVHPSPEGFLPADTSICQLSSVFIKAPDSFKSYQWSTGSTQTAIRVDQPGKYWLQVSDQHDCFGKDTIIVNPKECYKGFFIPTAFTPNNDNLNDNFRPLLFGNVVSYKFSIFNRWGEKIFETTDLLKGWDGKMKGVAQNSDVFIWQCSFKFADQPHELRKGIFTLVR